MCSKIKPFYKQNDSKPYCGGTDCPECEYDLHSSWCYCKAHKIKVMAGVSICGPKFQEQGHIKGVE